jgi:uncharacterized membrane protein
LLWLWRFLLYSFLGFLLEVCFAYAVRHPKKDRKCLLLLPLCPVYGLGAALILYLARLTGAGVLGVMVIGFFSASAAEYLMSYVYEHFLGVQFWDYSELPWNLGGRVCLPFSLCWSGLALVLVYGLSPVSDALLGRIPVWLGPPALILLLSDVLVSSVALRRAGTTEVLRWYHL